MNAQKNIKGINVIAFFVIYTSIICFLMCAISWHIINISYLNVYHKIYFLVGYNLLSLWLWAQYSLVIESILDTYERLMIKTRRMWEYKKQ